MIGGKRFVISKEQPFSAFDWGKIKFLSEPRLTHAEHLTVVHVFLEPGQGHLRHNHPGVEEILYIIAGKAEQMVEDDLEENNGKPQFMNVTAGDLVHIPPSVYHQTVNIGNSVLQLLAVYSPTGTEDLLRALPDYRELPQE